MFFFKQKTAYEMRISDWSSDVCSSDLYPADPFEELKKVFETVAMAKVSASAFEAKNLGLLRDSDVVVFNAYELLYVAKKVALSLAEAGYRPPLPAHVTVAGDVGTATFKASLANLQAGYFASPPDVDIDRKSTRLNSSH